MRSFVTATLVALATAGNVHKFFAESNFICEVCQKAVEFASNGESHELDKLYKLLPALQERINNMYDRKDEINLSRPLSTCQALDLCEVPDVLQMIMMEQPVDLHRHVNLVNNNPHSTWKAAIPDKFEGASLKEIRSIMGTVVDPAWTIKAETKHYEVAADSLPTNFDARTNWPECNGTINHVRDQSNCGSCWAHGTTEALNDRLCIASGGSFTPLLSVSDTTGCCNGVRCFSFGCNGGQVGTPWDWFTNTGVVTGGDYGDGTLCYDYTMAKCAHHVDSDTLPECDAIVQVEPTCNRTCATNGSINYSGDKHTAGSSYNLFGVNSIKQDIQTYGSVTAAFTVYEDFLTYSSGVYTHQTGDALGGHAIKCVGWGVEDNEDYWLCINSWNNTWGDQGTFKIKMGECGINNQMHAGVPGQ